MKRTISAVLACAVLAACADTAPVKIDTRAISEMPADVALSYLSNWRVPTELQSAVGKALTAHSSDRCFVFSNSAMTLRKGQTYPYDKLMLSVTTINFNNRGLPVDDGRYRSVRFTIAESTLTWCTFGNFYWDTENADINRRALAEINRIGTAFATLGGRIEKP